MLITRRELLSAMVLAPALAQARGLLIDALLIDVVTAALEAAKRAGASYSDARVHRRRNETVGVRDDHVESVVDSESYGIGVRVLVDGAWGFCSSSRVEVK